MPELHDQLSDEADLDLSALFQGLATGVLGVSLGTERFDPADLLAVLGAARPPDVAGLRASVDGAVGQAQARLDAGLPQPTLPDSLTALAGRLGAVRSALPVIDVPDLPGLNGLELRLDTVRTAVEAGPLADLLGLVPGLQWSGTLTRAGGSLGGVLDLLRVLAGLTATATASRHLVDHAEQLGSLLDAEAARAAAATLTALTADVALVAALRSADPQDAGAVDELAARVTTFLDAAVGVAERWAPGMGFGEAALLGLDVTGTASAIELARTALTGIDLAPLAALCADVRRAAAPLLDAPLPDPLAFADGFLGQAALLTAEARLAVQQWDVAATLAPLTDLSAVVLGPALQFQQALAGVGTEVRAALRAVRDLVDEIDVTPVADAVETTLRPVVDLLDDVEAGIARAEDTLTTVTTELVAGLQQAAGLVREASTTLGDGLGKVTSVLDGLRLQALGESLAQALRTVADALAAAQLRPYFDTAVDVITTAADVLERVPFGLLPTDVQQEVVDACRPIRELDLSEVEDALRGELATIRREFSEDVLHDVEAAYQRVVQFLATLDPQPHLAAFEAETVPQLRARIAEVDPAALLAPVDAALADVRTLLAGLDLEAEVLAPLRQVFAPVLQAVDALDPAELLAPARAEVDRVRTSLTDALPVEEVREAVLGLRDRAAALLARIDGPALVEVLDERVVRALADMPAGPPGGAFGSLLVSLAQASGFRADEPAVEDVIGWVRGDAPGGVVVRERLDRARAHVLTTRDAVALLDPAPLVAAAAAHHRALRAAVAVHPAGSPLVQALGPVLDALVPDELLGGLAANRRRYQAALEADALLLGALATSGRSEVTEAATRLRVALAPLAAFPARLRAVLATVGLDPAGRPLRLVLTDLLAEAVRGPVPGELAGLVEDATAKVTEALEVLTGSALRTVETVASVLDLIDLGPVADELTALHGQVREEVSQLSPDALVAPVVLSAGAVVDRVEAFDPLAPVRALVDAARAAADEVVASVRPTTAFAPVVELHQRVLRLATGLDVVSLLRPVLEALDGIAGQLDDGLDRTGDALRELQEACPSQVQEHSVGGSASVGVGGRS